MDEKAITQYKFLSPYNNGEAVGCKSLMIDNYRLDYLAHSPNEAQY